MKNIETPDKKHLEKIISDLRDGTFVIPDFQREFVWTPADVKELIRSIFEDYYIGTLLLWKASKENQRMLNCENIDGFTGKSDPGHIVLDGQQRLSALYYALFAPEKDFPNRKNRYLFFVKLDALIQSDFDNAFDYEWLSGNVAILLENQEQQFQKKVLPLNILGQKSRVFYKWLEGYQQYWSEKIGEESATAEKEEIERFFEDHLDNYYISYIELDRDIEVTKVCDIFTRINSTGIKLTIFDLLNALLRPKEIFLKDMWRKVSDELGEFQWSNTSVQILQTMSILKQGYCAPKFLYYLVPEAPKTIKNEDGGLETIRLVNTKEDFISLWNFTVENIRLTIRDLSNHRDFGAIKPNFVPYPTMLPIMTALNIEKEKLKGADKKVLHDKYKKWYWASIFTKNYSSSVESQMTRDYFEMQSWFDDDEKQPRVIEQFQNEINNLDLKSENSPGSAVYKAIFNMLILKGARDWDSFELPESYLVLDDHHIVPRSWGLSNGLGKRIDSIVNRTPLSDETNRIVINDQLPNVYLKALFDRFNEDEVYQLLATHLITPKAVDILMRPDFSPEDYEEFRAERQNAILTELRAMLRITNDEVVI